MERKGTFCTAFTTRIAFFKVVFIGKKGSLWKAKKRSLGVNFSYTDHFSEFGGYFTGEQTKHEIPF
jgi:hypothetical protein